MLSELSVVLGWAIWGAIALTSAVLCIRTAIRLGTHQPLGRVVPWQTLFLTLLAVWFFVNDGWDKIHLLWAGPLAVVAPLAVELLRPTR